MAQTAKIRTGEDSLPFLYPLYHDIKCKNHFCVFLCAVSCQSFKEAAKMTEREFVTVTEACDILSARGVNIGRDWISRKAAAGKIEGAQRVTSRLWLIPRVWAENYAKDTRGRKRTDEVC